MSKSTTTEKIFTSISLLFIILSYVVLIVTISYHNIKLINSDALIPYLFLIIGILYFIVGSLLKIQRLRKESYIGKSD